MTEMREFNERIISEFRENGGKVGPPFEGAPMVLITTTGAKSGKRHTTPLVYLPDGERVVIFASKAGAPTNPAWYHNLVANPDVHAEVGTDAGIEEYEATAVEVKGEERDALYGRQAEKFPNFAEYQEKTERIIPVIALERK